MDGGQPTGPLVRGSQVALGCGCFTISTLLFLAAFGGVVMIVWGWLIPDWRANHRYVANSCLVLDKKLDETTMEVVAAKTGARSQQTSYYPEFKIRYEVGGRKYETWTYEAIKIHSTDRVAQQRILDTFQVGETYPCWYDPDRPDKAVLVRSEQAPLLSVVLLIPIAFLVIAVAGLFISWKLWRPGRSSRGVPAYIAPKGDPAPPEIRPGRAARRGAFDPSQLGDPIAMRTDWTRTRSVGTNIRTRRLVEVDPDRLEFRASTAGLFVAVPFLVFGIAMFVASAAPGYTVGKGPGARVVPLPPYLRLPPPLPLI
jgi:hypothetical protein